MASEPAPCPLCGEPLYGWIAIPAPPRATPAGATPSADPLRVLDRCENCGVALERGTAPDLAAEWDAVHRASANGAGAVAVPNRASLQASLGGDGWAGLEALPGRLALTPRSLALLAEANRSRLGPVRHTRLGRNQLWMWQTLLNGLTFERHFVRRLRAGEIRPRGARARLAFAADLVVTVLGGVLVALVSLPLELVAALFRRGGEITAPALPARSAGG